MTGMLYVMLKQVPQQDYQTSFAELRHLLHGLLAAAQIQLCSVLVLAQTLLVFRYFYVTITCMIT